ncbi:MAG: hypothetical protein ACTHJZ_23320 [Trinickia sp.]
MNEPKTPIGGKLMSGTERLTVGDENTDMAFGEVQNKTAGYAPAVL